MSRQHFVRVGLFGHVGRFTAFDGAAHARGARVLVRTARGLEVGEVLAHAADEVPGEDGPLLRRLTVEDELLLDRLAQRRDAAYAACDALLRSRRVDAALVDVEHLFDGRSLYFYFLGETPSEVDSITAELAETYEAEAQIRPFTETLVNGCGPHCGTEQAAGCGAACSTCAVASACKK